MKFLEKLNKRASDAGLTPQVLTNVAKGVVIGVVAIAAFYPEIAAAANQALPTGGKSLGTIAGNVEKSLVGVASVVTAASYVLAFGFALGGAMKWKAYGEAPDRTPLKVPLTYWGICAICAALPEFIGTGVGTLFDNATVVNAPGT